LPSYEKFYNWDNSTAWFSRARTNLSEAEHATDNQIKVERAKVAAEQALKALLAKKGVSIKKHQTHNLKKLLDILEKQRVLQPLKLEKVKKLVDEIEHVQAYHKTSNTYVDVCYSAQVGHLRYPLKEELEITDEIAKRKCDAVRRLLEIIKEEIQN